MECLAGGGFCHAGQARRLTHARGVLPPRSRPLYPDNGPHLSDSSSVRGICGVSAGAYGVMTGFGLCANAISRPLAGRLSDKLGRRGFLIVGLTLLLLAYVTYAVTPRRAAFPVLSVASVLIGLGAGLFWPVLNAAVVEALPKQHRERPLGLVTATQSVSIAVGAAIGGTAAGLLGYRRAFLVAGAAWGAALVLAIYLGRRPAGVPTGRDAMPKGRLPVAAISPAAGFFLPKIALGAIVAFVPFYAHVGA